MADARGRIDWFTADPRAILELDGLHVPRSLCKTIRRAFYEIRIDTIFRSVIEGCARRPSTWISQKIVEAYSTLHTLGYAHSVEAWRGGRLRGGLYGLTLGGAFFGESMFADEADASKVCVVALVERLRARGFVLLDCQQQTAHMARFGATLISGRDYQSRLRLALQTQARFHP